MVLPKFTPPPQQSPESSEKHMVVPIIISFSLNTLNIFLNFKANLKKLPVHLSYQLAAHTSKKNTFFSFSHFSHASFGASFFLLWQKLTWQHFDIWLQQLFLPFAIGNILVYLPAMFLFYL